MCIWLEVHQRGGLIKKGEVFDDSVNTFSALYISLRLIECSYGIIYLPVTKIEVRRTSTSGHKTRYTNIANHDNQHYKINIPLSIK